MQTTLKQLPVDAFFKFNNAYYQKVEGWGTDTLVAHLVDANQTNAPVLLKVDTSAFVHNYVTVGVITEDTVVEHCVDCVLCSFEYLSDCTQVSDTNFKYVYLNSNGIIHRDNGPAVHSVNFDSLQYYKNGKLHREDGPANINTSYKFSVFDDAMTEPSFVYYLNNVPYTFEDYKTQLALLTNA